MNRYTHLLKYLALSVTLLLSGCVAPAPVYQTYGVCRASYLSQRELLQQRGSLIEELGYTQIQKYQRSQALERREGGSFRLVPGIVNPLPAIKVR